MKNIGLNINSSKFIDKKVIEDVIYKLKKYIKGSNIKIYYDSKGLQNIESEDLDVIISLGGDGTILRTARVVAKYEIPILGINMGNLGFLTGVESLELEEAILKLSEGRYNIEERMMLQCQVENGKEIESYISLNDIVISKGALSRIFKYEIFIDDNFYTSFKADGIIISTPTGSTAYSLSAGGPVAYPTLDVILLTPICPHSMQMRSIILESNSKINIQIQQKNERIFLTVDGQESINLKDCNDILIEKYNKKCKLIKLDGYNYFDVLRKKIF
ncbi:NAD(+)/NADH kinase [Clostridium sp. MB40-C1]|uniref:NAD(+)/NADH kinase n=1 Tax=Clostridium sp. MB40-C1 TaxID=3070996 RepID=UPI0027E13737|nr:NAD(+)/NADH kinase [Clostridium sp. MB40-C1]WMJ81868.1 NAD(+)/NADH kinase [Clostridium sp. MB40-C1]